MLIVGFGARPLAGSADAAIKNPQIISQSSIAQDTLTSTRNITLPAGIMANDTIMVWSAQYSQATTMTPPAGFTSISSDANMSYSSALFFKTAVGTESGTTVTWTGTANTNNSSACSVVVRGATLGVQSTIGAGALSTSYDVPPITPSWALNTNLYLIFGRNGFGTIGHVGTAPAGFTKLIETSIGGVTSNIFWKIARSTTEDPGPITWNIGGYLIAAVAVL